MNILFVPNKLEYIKKRKGEKGCLFCKIKKEEDLSVYRSKNFVISLNLYPYNPGHLLIFPISHMEDIRELSQNQFLELRTLLFYSLDILQDLYQPEGFNIGFNLGESSGASVKHLHLHIVPRYRNEIGFIDVVSKTRIIPQHPKETKDLLVSAFKKNLSNLKNLF